MTTNALGDLETDAKTVKRAQWEGYEFGLEAPNLVRVTNGSYGDALEGDESDESAARPDDCSCLPTFDDLPCWPCYRDGFETPNPATDG